MGKRYSTEEKNLMVAGIRYAEANKITKTKLAWSLAGLLGRQDSVLYQQLCELSRVMNDLKEDEEVVMQQEVVEDELTLTDENLDKRIGEVVSVRVIVVKTYGALCVVEGTTRTLLLHVSEIADEFIDDVNMYLAVDDIVQAMLIVSAKENRLALSTKKIGSVKRKEQKELSGVDW